MFNEITGVPVAIRDFYLEVTINEPLLNENGDQVTESKEVPSIDENGNEVMVTVLVPVYHDVVYVELKAKGEFKTLADVWRIAELHKGQNDELIAKFLGMYSESVQWQWHDEVLELLNHPVPIDEEVVLLERPQIIDVDGWFRQNYARLRQYAYPSCERQLEMMFDDSLTKSNKWQQTIVNVKMQYPKLSKD